MRAELEDTIELFVYFCQVDNVLALMLAGSNIRLAKIAVFVETEYADCLAKGS